MDHEYLSLDALAGRCKGRSKTAAGGGAE